MRKIVAIAGHWAVLALMAGCVSSSVPPDRRVTLAENLGRAVCVTDVRCAKGGGEYLTLQANVVNNTRSPIGVEWKVQWLDADGLAIDSVLSTWNRVMIHPKDTVGLKNTAPRQDAADMRLYVRRVRR